MTHPVAVNVMPICPQCGSTFTIDPNAETERDIWRQGIGVMPHVETVRVTVPVAFCNGCEFIVVLDGRPQ